MYYGLNYIWNILGKTMLFNNPSLKICVLHQNIICNNGNLVPSFNLLRGWPHYDRSDIIIIPRRHIAIYPDPDDCPLARVGLLFECFALLCFRCLHPWWCWWDEFVCSVHSRVITYEMGEQARASHSCHAFGIAPHQGFKSRARAHNCCRKLSCQMPRANQTRTCRTAGEAQGPKDESWTNDTEGKKQKHNQISLIPIKKLLLFYFLLFIQYWFMFFIIILGKYYLKYHSVGLNAVKKTLFIKTPQSQSI